MFSGISYIFSTTRQSVELLFDQQSRSASKTQERMIENDLGSQFSSIRFDTKCETSFEHQNLVSIEPFIDT
jgi:hypothetical protein